LKVNTDTTFKTVCPYCVADHTDGGSYNSVKQRLRSMYKVELCVVP